MRVSLSTNEILEELEFLSTLGKNPPFDYPAFLFETDFIDLFIHIIKPAPQKSNIIPFVHRLINKALKESIAQISYIRDKYNVDGSGISKLISEKAFIRSGIRKAYNKKIPGKSPKGLGIKPWKAYNNWLLAHILWKAFVQSHDPHVKLLGMQEEYSQAAIKTLYHPHYRPLWAMKGAFMKAGKPDHGYANEDIFIRPLTEWHMFTKKQDKFSASKSRLSKAND